MSFLEEQCLTRAAFDDRNTKLNWKGDRLTTIAHKAKLIYELSRKTMSHKAMSDDTNSITSSALS